MNRILSIALVLATTLAAAATSSAQERQLKVTVPFNFNVGGETLPAGTYTITNNRRAPDFLVLKNADKPVSIQTMGMLDRENNPKMANVLVFHKYGEQYFLSRIRSKGTLMDFDFVPSKAEKKVRKQSEEAGGYSKDPVLVALQ